MVKKNWKIYLFVLLTQSTNVTDTDTQTPHDSKGRAAKMYSLYRQTAYTRQIWQLNTFFIVQHVQHS